jgi:hypothetical protein
MDPPHAITHSCFYCQELTLNLDTDIIGPHYDDPTAMEEGITILCRSKDTASKAATQGCLFYQRMLRNASPNIKEGVHILVLSFKFEPGYVLLNPEMHTFWTDRTPRANEHHSYPSSSVEFEAYTTKGIAFKRTTFYTHTDQVLPQIMPRRYIFTADRSNATRL